MMIVVEGIFCIILTYVGLAVMSCIIVIAIAGICRLIIIKMDESLSILYSIAITMIFILTILKVSI